MNIQNTLIIISNSIFGIQLNCFIIAFIASTDYPYYSRISPDVVTVQKTFMIISNSICGMK